MATSEKDLFLRWRPRRHAFFMRMAHPFHGQDPEETARAEFGGYPPVTAFDGAVVADDTTNRFMALIQGFPSTRWHRDTGSTLGIPASDSGTVFSPIGGPGATYGVTAIDAITGLSRWTFAPEGLPRDRQSTRDLTMLRYVRKIRPRGNGQVDTRTSEGLKAALLQALEHGFDEDLSSRKIHVSQPYSLLPHGHWTNGGLVHTGGRMYSEINGTIAALDSRTGSPVWRRPLPAGTWVRSLVATDKHLVMCLSNGPRRPLWDRRALSGEEHFLAAWQLHDGKEVWSERVARPGSLALADGLVFFANGDLRVLGPAERTYRLAADSDVARDYYRPPGEPGMPLASDCGPAGEPARPATATGPGAEVRGDASILRLASDLNLGELLRKARDRRRAAQGVPLLIQLDWLDARRENPRGSTGPKLTRERVEALLSLYARLAEEAEPEYFDVAPEINIYLRRYPDQAGVVQDLITRARNTVQQIVPGCRVLVSLNAEVALDVYGRMLNHRPFGNLPPLSPENARGMEPILTLVDTLGISSQPQTAFPSAEQMPPDYLLRLKVALPRHALLLTSLIIRADKNDFLSRTAQAGFGERLLEASYWMNARLVAQPDWVGYTQPPRDPEGKAPTDLVQLAMGRWRGAVRREQRETLTLVPPAEPSVRNHALLGPVARSN